MGLNGSGWSDSVRRPENEAWRPLRLSQITQNAAKEVEPWRS